MAPPDDDAEAIAWIRGEMERRSVAGDLASVANACVACSGHARSVFGRPLPLDPAGRAVLLAFGRDLIARRVPTLSRRACAALAILAHEPGIAIDLAPRLAELDAARRQAREAIVDDEPRNPPLEAMLDAEVLADWLQGQGHPRGELIALQLRAERDPDVAAAAAGHLGAHAAALLGPLAAHAAAFTWRRGFIHGARLRTTADSDDELPDMLELLLAHPSGRRLEALALGSTGDDGAFDAALELLVARAPATLRSLELGNLDRESTDVIGVYAGDLPPLYRAFPALERLVVRAGTFSVGFMRLPALVHLELLTLALDGFHASSIASADWPCLRSLELWFGGGNARLANLRDLLDGGQVPVLRDLALRDTAFTDELCAALATSPLAGQLDRLDLSLGTMTAAGADALVRAAGAFGQLAELDVSLNYLDPAAVARVLRAFPRARVHEQREADEDGERHPAIME